MERRDFLKSAAVAAAALTAGPAIADELPLGDLPNTRYPDPRVESIDKRFK
jgi:gluconolactonase